VYNAIYHILWYKRRASKKSQHLTTCNVLGIFSSIFFSLRKDIFTASTQCLGEIIGLSQGVRYTRERSGEWLIRFCWVYNTQSCTGRWGNFTRLYYHCSRVKCIAYNTPYGEVKKEKMRKKIVRPCNMAYAHIALHRRGKGSPNSTWTRNGDKSFTNAHKRLASLTFVCVCVIYSGIHKRVYFFPSCWTSHCLTTFPCSWPKTNPQYIYIYIYVLYLKTM